MNATEKKYNVVGRKNTVNRVVKFMLISLGVWPDASCVTFCRIFWSITIAIVQFWHYRYFLTHYHSIDMFDFTEWFSSFLGYWKLFTKFVCFWLNQRIFGKILTMMTEDWSDCSNNDIEMRETADKAKTSDYVTNALIAFHSFALLSYGTSIILADVDVTNRTIELPHLHKMEVPFDINTQRTYKIVLITEVMYMLAAGVGINIPNILLLTLVLHTGGQINILRGWITKLQPETNENKRESFVIATNKIIRKHQKIIYFSENVKNLYSIIALLQFASNTVMICLLGFLVVTALGSPGATGKIVRSLSYYSVTNIEAFIFCYAGEYLINKSRAIGLAAYNCQWYDLAPKQSRVLLFILLRSQKQLTLTVGKMTDLSLRCFASIMNSAASYLSVLLAMQ
ncbi:odorant receptor 13a-like [Linepithema humile]|uniref:odorant receptor 13a-like n=1 Tax=Linepithema humile TaxID=83485 RepID=UPI0006239D07|nr:PREDICTED: odorant receptor 13a-like [Linepithema humile]